MTPHNADSTFKPDYYHQFSTLPSCFLTESYSSLTNIKEQMTAQKAYLFLYMFKQAETSISILIE